MTQKKAPVRRTTQLRGGAAISGRALEAPPSMAELGLGEMPDESDPEGRARYFMNMIEALQKHSSVEARRIRGVLLDVLNAYFKERDVDRDEARRGLVVRLAAVEVGLMEMVHKITLKMRDKITEHARRLGTATPPGQVAHRFAEGMNKVVESMDLMLDAARTRDKDKRTRATAMMDEANELLTGVSKIGPPPATPPKGPPPGKSAPSKSAASKTTASKSGPSKGASRTATKSASGKAGSRSSGKSSGTKRR